MTPQFDKNTGKPVTFDILTDKLINCLHHGRYGLFDALTIQRNVPVDFIDEDGAADPATLARHRIVIVTEPNIPAATLTALLAWGAKGGTLVFVG